MLLKFLGVLTGMAKPPGFCITESLPVHCMVSTEVTRSVTAGSSIQEQHQDLPVGQSRIGVWGTSSAWMEGKPASRVGKEDFCLSSDDFSISLGGALRRDENRMAARKLVRKPAVG